MHSYLNSPCIHSLAKMLTVCILDGDSSLIHYHCRIEFIFNHQPPSGNIAFIFYFLASDDLSGLLVSFTNSLDPDQDRQNVGPDLGPNCLTLLKWS